MTRTTRRMMTVGALAIVASIALAIPITGVLTFGVGMAIMTSPMNPVYGVSGIVAWLIFTLVLATIASALPARRASRSSSTSCRGARRP